MPSGAPQPSSDCRCACGSLLARLVEGGVELKCRRCKRTHFVPLEGSGRRGLDPEREPRLRAAAQVRG